MARKSKLHKEVSLLSLYFLAHSHSSSCSSQFHSFLVYFSYFPFEKIISSAVLCFHTFSWTMLTSAYNIFFFDTSWLLLLIWWFTSIWLYFTLETIFLSLFFFLLPSYLFISSFYGISSFWVVRRILYLFFSINSPDCL